MAKSKATKDSESSEESNSTIPVPNTDISSNALLPDETREQDPRLGPPRSLSPLWDIELDLNPSEDESSQPPSGKPTIPEDIAQSALPSRERVPSPDWDIDWTEEAENDSSDLVVGQEEDAIAMPARKKRRTNPFSSTPL